jgi:hypothetical protein
MPEGPGEGDSEDRGHRKPLQIMRFSGLEMILLAFLIRIAAEYFFRM